MMHLIDCFTELPVYVGMILKEKPGQGFERVYANIDALIRRSKERAAQGNYSDQAWLDGFFPIASWVDESILCSDLEWKEEWIRCQLQRRFFDMNNAGEAFFQKLESYESISPEVLAVFDLVLATGFRGSYYQNSSMQTLTAIRENITARLRGTMDLAYAGALFGDAYQPKSQEKKDRKHRFMALMNVFNVLVVIVPLIVLIFMHMVFESHLDDLIDKYFGKQTSKHLVVDHAKNH
jgi:type VI secretion system protein ImpK